MVVILSLFPAFLKLSQGMQMTWGNSSNSSRLQLCAVSFSLTKVIDQYLEVVYMM